MNSLCTISGHGFRGVSAVPSILGSSNNGQSLVGWANKRYPSVTGNFVVTTTGGQTCFYANGDLTNYIYINTVFSSFIGKTIGFNIYLTGGCPGLIFGATSSGAGNAFRFETRPYPSGFTTSPGWYGYGTFQSNYTWTLNTWLAISIPITSGGVATLYVNGVSSGFTITIADSGGYIGFNADGGGGSVSINNITVT